MICVVAEHVRERRCVGREVVHATDVVLACRLCVQRLRQQNYVLGVQVPLAHVYNSLTDGIIGTAVLVPDDRSRIVNGIAVAHDLVVDVALLHAGVNATLLRVVHTHRSLEDRTHSSLFRQSDKW